MRVPSFQEYRFFSTNMGQKQADLSKLFGQMTSGKRVEAAGDDSVAMISIHNLKQQSTLNQQYTNMADLALNRLAQEETYLKNGDDLVQNTREKMLGAINGSVDANGLNSLAQDMQANFDAMLDLANTRDESGNYIFGGTKTDKPPFYKDADGNVQYRGNDGQRYLQVASSIQVPISDAGSKLFQQVPNPFGDYTPDYQRTTGSDFFIEKAENCTDSAEKYDIEFVTMDDGSTGFLAKDSSGAYVPAQKRTDPNDPTSPLLPPEPQPVDMVNNQIVIDDGTGSADSQKVKIIFSGTPTVTESGADKVSIQPEKNIDAFAAMQNAINNVKEGSNTANISVGVKQMDAISKHLNSVRGEVGTRMQAAETAKEDHADNDVVVKTALSSQEDLDYPTAALQFSMMSLAMQASQQTFVKLQGMSLFNYL
ncbi:flagellar hook-associated protein FlgL [Plesiomonas shigelloides]|uniref:flagellar hook-associated protein FlgL n=1 Tax=Plesiomonas shigelloides TaxID=703 RepID=UPI003EC060E9